MTRKWLSGGGLMLAAALFVAVNIVTGETLSSWRLDVTENRLFTLSKGTRNILQSLTEPVTMLTATNNAAASISPPPESHLRVI